MPGHRNGVFLLIVRSEVYFVRKENAWGGLCLERAASVLLLLLLLLLLVILL